FGNCAGDGLRCADGCLGKCVPGDGGQPFARLGDVLNDEQVFQSAPLLSAKGKRACRRAPCVPVIDSVPPSPKMRECMLLRPRAGFGSASSKPLPLSDTLSSISPDGSPI